MNRVRVLGVLIVGTLVGALPVFSADTSKRPRSVLDGVKQLGKPVTYTETKIPLGELVQKVAEDTGAPLTAAKDVADEPVALVVKAFSARELLVQLADLLDYTWSRRGKAGAWRYEIYQDLGGQQREEALWRAVYADIVRRLRYDLATAVELAALTPEQLQQIRDDWRKRSAELGKLPAEQREVAMRSPEVLELRWRAGLTQYVSSPFSRTLARLVGGLTDSQWGLLQSGQMLVFSTNPQPGELRLPGETAVVLRTAQPALFDAWIKRPLDTAEEQRQNEMREQWSAATGYRVTVSIRAPAGAGVLGVCANATPIRSDAPEGARWPGYPFAGGTSLNIGTPAIDYRQPAPPEETPEQRALLDRDPVLGVKKLFRPEAKPSIDPNGLPEWGRALLVDLARIYGVNLISDAYWGSRPFRPDLGRVPASGEPAALYTLLDRHFYRCDRVGHLVRLRSRKWFLDRPREIPLRLVRSWQASWDRKGGLSLDEYVEIARGLTGAQATNLPTTIREAGLPSDLEAVPPARRALQLYGALTAAQRGALWRGGAIPIARMTPVQRALFLATVQERAPWVVPAGLAQRTPGSLSLTAQPFLRTRVKHGVVPRQATEPLPTGGAESPVPPEPPAPRPGAPPDVIRQPVTQVSLVLQYGSETQDTYRLTVAQSAR